MAREVEKKIGSLIVYSDGTFLLKNVPTWYSQIAHPKAFEEGASEKFSLQAFLSKEDHADEIAWLEKTLKAKMPKRHDWDDIPTKNRCFLDGSKVGDEGSDITTQYRLKFAANATHAPNVRKSSGALLSRRIPDEMREIEDLTDGASNNGRLMNILGSFYAWEHKKYGAGVGMNVMTVQVLNKWTDMSFGSSGNDTGNDIDDWDEDEDVDF